MDVRDLKALLNNVKNGDLEVDEAVERLRHLPFEEIECASVDHHRELRQGFPEVILGDGNQAVGEDGNTITVPVRDAGNAFILLRGSGETTLELTCWPHGSGSILNNKGERIAVPDMPNDQPPGEWNRFEISVSDNRVNITLNGRMVIRDFYLDSPRQKGKIGLQYEGYPVEFANIYMLEL